MQTKSVPTSAARLRPPPSHPIYHDNEGLSPKKTAFIIVTVIGCIAILWPNVFYPMLFGSNPANDVNKTPNYRDRGAPPGCCFNATPLVMGPHLYRKQIFLSPSEMSLRQERPAHLHPDSVYKAMRERGRAIPATPSIPIVERQANKPRFVDGRPGPIPGMRPPMGAGSIHQPQPKGGSMGFIMPLYTIGIVIFFGYTIMKLVFKKQNSNYGAVQSDPQFRKEVFGKDNKDSKLGFCQPISMTTTSTNNFSTCTKSIESDVTSQMLNANLSAATNLQQQQQQELIQQQQYEQELQAAARNGKTFSKEKDQLMEIDKLRKKLEETERAMAKLIAVMKSDQYELK